MSDVCLLLDGRYPGGGGVATWVDSLIRTLPALSFSVVALGSGCCAAPVSRLSRPSNVDAVVEIPLPEGVDPTCLPDDDLEVLAAAVPDATVHHAMSVGAASRVAARATSIRGGSFLLTEHGIAWREKALGQLMTDRPADQALEATSARRAAIDAYGRALTVTSVSRSGALWQRRLGLAPNRILYLPNPAPALRIRPRPQQSEALGTPVIGMVGRVVRLKDVVTFIRSAALIAAEMPSARFVVLGSVHEDQHYAARCMELVAFLGLADRFDFLGDVDAWAWYPVLDVVVLTSRSEAQPFAVLEALAAARPVVATAAGDVPQLLAQAGAAHRVVPIADARAVASGVLQTLHEQQRDRRRGRASGPFATQLPTEAQNAAAYARLYDRAADGAVYSSVGAA